MTSSRDCCGACSSQRYICDQNFIWISEKKNNGQVKKKINSMFPRLPIRVVRLWRRHQHKVLAALIAVNCAVLYAERTIRGGGKGGGSGGGGGGLSGRRGDGGKRAPNSQGQSGRNYVCVCDDFTFYYFFLEDAVELDLLLYTSIPHADPAQHLAHLLNLTCTSHGAPVLVAPPPPPPPHYELGAASAAASAAAAADLALSSPRPALVIWDGGRRFVDFASFGLRNPIHLSLVREPYDWLRARFRADR